MERQKIYNAFDNITLSEESANRMLDNILASASEISPERKDGSMKKISRKPILIAAVVIVMLLTMGAVVVKLSISDLKMGEYVIPGYSITGKPAFYPTVPENTVNHILSLYEINSTPDNKVDSEVTIPDETRYTISLQGITGTPNYNAVQEWQEFEAGYDQDHVLLREADENGFMRPAEYRAYGVYTQEMIDKVDEICEKYGLKLAGAVTIVQRDETDIFFDNLGITQLHHKDTDIEVTYGSGYFYECGNFQISFDIKTADNVSLSCDIRYCDKAYFDTVAFSISATSDVKQWNYTTEDGNELLIIHSDDWARIFCNRDDAFVSVYICRYDILLGDYAPITKEEAKQVADVIDFNVKPQI